MASHDTPPESAPREPAAASPLQPVIEACDSVGKGTDSAVYRGGVQFSDLPIEVKELIYEYAMLMNKEFDKPLCAAPVQENDPGRLSFPRLPGICCLNKAEHTIATLVLMRKTTLRLSQDTDRDIMAAWLENIGVTIEKAFASIKKVELRCDSMSRVTSLVQDIMFLKRCTAVREVTVRFEEKALGSLYDAESFVDKERALTFEILQHFHLDDIYTCISLSNLKLQFDVSLWTATFDYHGYEAVSLEMYKNALNMVLRMDEVFAAENRWNLKIRAFSNQPPLPVDPSSK